MFCPKCGQQCRNDFAFCINCGFPVQQELKRQNEELQRQNTVSRNNAEQVTQILSTQQKAKNAENEPIQPEAKKKKKIKNSRKSKRKFFTPKKIIIGSSVLVVLIAVGIFSFFAIRNKMERDFFEEHPTAYVLHSIERYFDNSEKDNAVYNVLKNSLTSGTIKTTYTGEYTDEFSRPQKLENSFSIGYDFDNYKFSLSEENQFHYLENYQLFDLCYNYRGNIVQKMNDSNYIKIVQKMNDSDPSVKNYVNLYTDVDKVNFRSNVGKQRDYYLDLANVRSDYQKSIFANGEKYSPNIENEAFDIYEAIYKIVAKKGENNEKISDIFNNLFKIIEKNGKVTISEETINAGGVATETDTVAYTFDYYSIQDIIGDTKEQTMLILNEYQEELKSATYNNETLYEILKEKLDEIDSPYNVNNVSINLSVDIKAYLDKKTHQAVKLEFSIKNFEGNNSKISVETEFPFNPETVFSMTIGMKDKSEKEGTVTIQLTKQNTNNMVDYELEEDVKFSQSSDDENNLYAGYTSKLNDGFLRNTPNNYSGNIKYLFSYNQSEKILTIKSSFSDSKGQSESKIFKENVNLSYDKIQFSYDYVDYLNFTENDKYYEYSEDTNSSILVSVEISSTPYINEFVGANNVLEMNLAELEDIKSYYEEKRYNNRQKYTFDIVFNGKTVGISADQSEASELNSACTDVYAGIMSGTIKNGDTYGNNKTVRFAADEGANSYERKQAAYSATVMEVMDYCGLSFDDDTLKKFGYDSNGNIRARNDKSNSDELKSLSTYTSLGDLYEPENSSYYEY